MAAFDLRIHALSLFMWFGIFFFVGRFSMEVLVIILVVGGLAIFAAIKFTEGPSDLNLPPGFGGDQ